MSYLNSHQSEIDNAVEAHRLRHYEGLVAEAKEQSGASKAFALMFPGEAHAVYVVSYWTDRYVAQEFFPAGVTKAGVIQGLIDAKDTFADAGEPSYPNPAYINCIELLPSGHWAPVQLFRSE